RAHLGARSDFDLLLNGCNVTEPSGLDNVRCLSRHSSHDNQVAARLLQLPEKKSHLLCCYSLRRSSTNCKTVGKKIYMNY
ncbi:unnamed protein product, partial [Amoebophrya sp. A25]